MRGHARRVGGLLVLAIVGYTMGGCAGDGSGVPALSGLTLPTLTDETETTSTATTTVTEPTTTTQPETTTVIETVTTETEPTKDATTTIETETTDTTPTEPATTTVPTDTSDESEEESFWRARARARDRRCGGWRDGNRDHNDRNPAAVAGFVIWRRKWREEPPPS